MKSELHIAFADKIVRRSSILSAILFILQTVYLCWTYIKLPPFVPVFNQMPWGDDRLGTRPEIALPLFISFAFAVFNLLLLAKLYKKTPLVSRILSITTLLITTLACIFLFQTLQLIV